MTVRRNSTNPVGVDMVSGARPFSPLDASENGSEKLHDDQFDSHLEQVPILQF